MNSPVSSPSGQVGTIDRPHYFEGLVESDDQTGVHQHRQYFTYRTDAGLIAGTATSILFTLEEPASRVWPSFKDFNLWQNSYHHYYSGVVGDLEGRTVRLEVGPDQQSANRPSAEYTITRVIPQHVIVMSQISKTQVWPEHGRVEGIAGFMVFMLSEHLSKTFISILMQHEQVTQNRTVDEALAFWKKTAPENLMKWRDHFIPTLKSLVAIERAASI